MRYFKHYFAEEVAVGGVGVAEAFATHVEFANESDSIEGASGVVD